jgi:lysophospholipase L1-like esterase
MEIKPVRILLLLLYVSIFLGLLHLITTEEVNLLGFKIKIPKYAQIFETKEKTEYADISKIQEQFQKNNSNNPSKNINEDNQNPVYVPDSLKINDKLRIQFPKGKEDLLKGFFEALDNLRKNKDTIIRVVHFGDSQLEGDRITAYLREKFQHSFGGSGVGFLTIIDKLATKASILQNTKSNWQQFPMYGFKYNQQASNYFGMLGDYYKMVVPQKPTWTKAHVNYIKSPAPYSTPTQQKVEKVRVYYRNPDAPFEISLQIEGKELNKQKIEKNEDFSGYYYDLEAPFEKISVNFATGSKSPEIYGVALDGKTGITFDNVPLRGSSGLEFTRIPKKHWEQQIKKMNIKFIIMQFGVNIVPNPLPDYQFYEDEFYAQLKYIKSIAPDISILVIGVSDMSRNVGGKYVSYPNIEKIRNAQRNAAFKANCAFWDLYEAMGGKNSMPSWVEAKPEPLATKDYTHFTAKGAGVVSEMLYKALMTEYDAYSQFFN